MRMIERIRAPEADDLPSYPTEYGIRLTCGLWLGERSHWHEEPTHALRFACEAIAFAVAFEWFDLDTDKFTVEPIPGRF